MTDDFHVVPYTDHCARVADRADHALIGLSPWNGRFTPRKVEALIGWAASTFRTLDVVIPSYESAYTLIAAGTPPLQAVRRARRAVVKLRVPALRALRRVGLGQAHLHTTTTLTGRKRYRALRRAIAVGYRHDPAIRAACQHTARAAIRAADGAEPAPAQIDTAARYAIAELPLFADAPGIFAVPSSVVVYHRHIALADPLLDGSAEAVALCPDQGFVVAYPVSSPQLARSRP